MELGAKWEENTREDMSGADKKARRTKFGGGINCRQSGKKRY